jgi:hypothetical protein
MYDILGISYTLQKSENICKLLYMEITVIWDVEVCSLVDRKLLCLLPG